MRINLRNTLYEIGLSTALCLIGVCMLPAAFQHIGTLCKVGIAAFCNASHAAAKLLHARQLSFAHFGTARRTRSGARCADAAASTGCLRGRRRRIEMRLGTLGTPCQFFCRIFFFCRGKLLLYVRLLHQHISTVLQFQLIMYTLLRFSKRVIYNSDLTYQIFVLESIRDSLGTWNLAKTTTPTNFFAVIYHCSFF